MSERKEKKKEMILDTAFKLFLEKGYSNTKIIDIASAAGIGKGTVYEYFESKESLLLELINTKIKQDYMQYYKVIGEKISCCEKLKAYLEFEIETTEKYKSNVTDFKQQLLSSSNGIAMEIMDTIHEIIHFQFECVHQVITEGIETGEFRNVDSYTATSCFIGSIAFYLSMLHGPSCCKNMKFQQKFFNNKQEEVLDFIFNGLLA